MSQFKTSEISRIYYDKNIENFSSLGIGYLIRAMGEGKKVAFVSFENNAQKFINFIENLSLSYSFIKSLKRFQVDMYNYVDENKISKTIIPLVEFCNIADEMFWKSLLNYDLVIFDNFLLKEKNKIKLIATLKNRSPLTKIVLTIKNENDFIKLKDNFNKSITCNYVKDQNTALTKKKIVNITGEGRGKSLFALGELIRNFIYKKSVKLIYFDKGDDIYGDAFFFSALKKWSKENNLYGSFDFVKTGIRRFDGRGFRIENIQLDSKEAKESLDLLKTSLKKQSPVVADELNTMIGKGILDLQDVLSVLREVNNELILTGKNSPKEILSLSSKVIELKESN